MLNLLRVAGISAFLLGQIVECRSRSLVPRQASYAKYINATYSNVTEVELQISVNGGGRNETAPLLYGWMFEDISVGGLSLVEDPRLPLDNQHSGDGGLYAEMITNRAFQGDCCG